MFQTKQNDEIKAKWDTFLLVSEDDVQDFMFFNAELKNYNIFRYSLKVEPGSRNPGLPSKFERGGPGPASKCKTGTPE